MGKKIKVSKLKTGEKFYHNFFGQGIIIFYKDVPLKYRCNDIPEEYKYKGNHYPEDLIWAKIFDGSYVGLRRRTNVRKTNENKTNTSNCNCSAPNYVETGFTSLWIICKNCGKEKG